MPRLLHTLLGLGALVLGSAEAAVNISATFTPATISASGTTNYVMTVSSTEVVPLTNMGLNLSINGAVSISTTPVSNSCNFTVSTSGANFTLSGGTLAAAPVSGSSSCQLSLQVTTVNTPGSYTTTLPGSTLMTTEGYSNLGAASASFNLAPLSEPQLSAVNLDTRAASTSPEVNNPLALLGDIGGSSYAVQLKNNNTVAVSIGGSRLYAPRFSSNPRLSAASLSAGCVASTITPSVPDTQFPRPYSYYVDLGTLTIPAQQSCQIVFDVLDIQPSQNIYSADEPTYGIEGAETFNYTGTMTNTGADYYNSVTRLFKTPLSFSLMIANARNLTVTPTTTQIPLSLQVMNVTTQTRSFTTKLALPPGLDESASTITVTGAGCTTSGVSFSRDSDLNWTFTAAQVPAATSCTWRVSLAPGTAVSRYLRIPNASILTDWRSTAATIPYDAASAGLMVPTTGTSTHASVGFYIHGPQSDILTLRNDTRTDMGGVNATINWTTGWIASLADSSTTCGGTLSLSDQSLTMTGGTLLSGQSCRVVVAFLPENVTPINFMHFYTATVTTDSGPSFSPVPSAYTYTLAPYVGGGVNPQYIATGEETNFSFYLYNTTIKSHSNERALLTLNSATLNTNTVKLDCVNQSGVNLLSTTIPASDISLSGGVYTLQLPALPQPVLNKTVPYDQSTIPPVSCTISGQLKNNTEVNESISGQFSSPASSSGFAGPSYQPYQTVANPTYSSSLSFSPTTVRAGQNATVTFNGPTPTSSKVTQTLVRRTVTLPAGLLFNPHPSYKVGTYWTANSTQINPTCDAAGTCPLNYGFDPWMVSADRKTLTYYTTTNGQAVNMPVTATKFGDLTVTQLAVNTTPRRGGTAQLLGDTSATLKVDPSLVIGMEWATPSIYSGQSADLQLSVSNANPISDIITVPVFVGSVASASTPNLSGTCGGTLSWNSGSKTATLGNISLPSNGDCTATLAVPHGSVGSNTPSTAQIAAGAARATNSNTGNQFALSSQLSVLAITQCLQVSGAPSNSGTFTSPGTASLSSALINTGTQTLGSGGVTWTTPSANASYSFDGATSAATLQQAWANRISEKGQLAPGVVSVLTATYTNASGQARGTVITVPLTATSSGNICTASLTHTVTTIKADPKITLEQARCAVNASGAVTCDPLTSEPVTMKPCEVIRYRFTASNTGDAPLKDAALHLIPPDGTTGVAWQASGALLARTDGGSWTLNNAARLPLSAPLEVRSQASGLIPGHLGAGLTLQAIMDVQVKGVGCVAPH